MSYTPTTWAAGDTVTAAKLNKLEQGVATGGGVLVVHVDDDTGVFNKTWQEICDAMAAGQIVSIPSANSEVEAYTTLIGTAWLTSDDKYGLWLFGTRAETDPPIAIAQTANDYPAWGQPSVV